MPADRVPNAGGLPAWLPNAITATRIALVPVALIAAETCRAAVAGGASGSGARCMAISVFLAIGASDVADGWLARRLGLETRLGALLDAVADKLAQVSLVVFLAMRAEPAFTPLPLWLAPLVVLRELLLLGGWLVLRRRLEAPRVVHRLHGKLTSAVMFALILAALLEVPRAWVAAGAPVVALGALASAGLYLRDGWAQVARRA